MSAATFLDIVDRSPEFTDFFGELSSNAGVTRIHGPLLIILGTDGDVGNGKTWRRSNPRLNIPARPCRVDTIQIQGADHMYAGQESHVAEVIAAWVDTLAPETAGGSHKNP